MRKKFVFVMMILLGAVLLSACAGGALHGTTWAGLAADGNTAYLADAAIVYGISLDNGRELWRFSPGDDNKAQFYSNPVIAPNGLVIVGSAAGKHTLYALDPNDIVSNENIKSPVAKWTFNGAGGPWVAPPLVTGNLLFAPNSDGNLYVLSLNDGQSAKQALKVVDLGGRLWAKPVTDGERVFVTSLDHGVYAVDIETYDVVWHKDVNGAIPGSPILGPDGMLYVGSLGSQLEKFDPATGNHQPVLDAENWIWSTPGLEDDTLYFADVDGNFYSFNTSTGQPNWAPVKPDGPITASPLIQNDHILVATESGSLFAMDHDGKVLWTEEVGGKIYTTPVAAGGLTIVAPLETDFYLAALDSNGRRVWTFTPEN